MTDWPHFTAKELACRCGCDAKMHPEFMETLERVRVCYGSPMVINSAVRCFDYNAKVGGAVESMHLKGRAVDVSISGADALDLIEAALACGINGVGVKQHGQGRFLHLDDRAKPTIWSYG